MKSTNNKHITKRGIRSSEEYEMFSSLDLIISNSLPMNNKEEEEEEGWEEKLVQSNQSLSPQYRVSKTLISDTVFCLV